MISPFIKVGLRGFGLRVNLSTEKLEEIKKTVKKILNSARYKHTLSVLKMAILLAEKYIM